jgi:hypothetical protein
MPGWAHRASREHCKPCFSRKFARRSHYPSLGRSSNPDRRRTIYRTIAGLSRTNHEYDRTVWLDRCAGSLDTTRHSSLALDLGIHRPDHGHSQRASLDHSRKARAPSRRCSNVQPAVACPLSKAVFNTSLPNETRSGVIGVNPRLRAVPKDRRPAARFKMNSSDVD